MKNIISENKKKFVIILIAILLIICAIVGVFMYHKYQRQKESDTYTAQITEYNDSFSNADDRGKKIEILRNISNDFTAYSKTGTPLDEIIQKYNNEINTMKSYFISEYEKTLSDNTLDNLEEIADKERINTAKSNLSVLSETITSEMYTVCTDEEALTYTGSINTLILSYEKRIAEIEEQEIKEAEEKARQDEEARQAAQQASSGFGDYDSSGSSSGGSYGGSTSNGRYQTGTSWYTDSDGTTEYKEYSDGSWTAQDEQGNSWSSDDLKEWLD